MDFRLAEKWLAHRRPKARQERRPLANPARRRPPAHRSLAMGQRSFRPSGKRAGRQARLRGCRETARSEEHTSELQSLMRISYAVFCLKKKTKHKTTKEIYQYKK